MTGGHRAAGDHGSVEPGEPRPLVTAAPRVLCGEGWRDLQSVSIVQR